MIRVMRWALLIVAVLGCCPWRTQAQGMQQTVEHSTRYRTIQVDGLKIFFRESGPKNGPTLLLLHGLPSSSRMFEPLFARLSDRYHLVAPDTLASGTATGPIRKNSRTPSIMSPRS